MSNTSARTVIPTCFWRASSDVNLRAASYLKSRDAQIKQLDFTLRDASAFANACRSASDQHADRNPRQPLRRNDGTERTFRIRDAVRLELSENISHYLTCISLLDTAKYHT